MKLLKLTLLFFALVALQIATAQWLNVPPPVEARGLMIVGGGVPVVGGGSCTRLITQDTDNDYWISTFALSQKIKVTTSTVVCEVQIKMKEQEAGDNISMTVGFWDAVEGGNQIGTTSIATLVDGATYAWYTFTWASNPTLTADCWLRLMGGATDIYWNASLADTYETGNNYDGYRGGTEVGPNTDYTFRINSMQ